MPLPFILGAAAVIAGTVGVGSGIHGGVKMKEANDTLKSAQRRNERNVERFKKTSRSAEQTMDKLGALELDILKSFERFSDLIEKIQNRPEFKEYKKNGVTLPKYDKEEITTVSVGAGVLLGGLGGAAAGTAGGFAAAGATTSAVMAFGTASTGTAIASLSGAAATNATLAALGGGTALATGGVGGGMALGTAVLGGVTLGVGLLVGGIIFNFTGSKLSDKADEAWAEVRRAERQIDEACDYLNLLESTADRYIQQLQKVKEIYDKNLEALSRIIISQGKTEWRSFSDTEKLITENTVLLVSLLYKMCQVNLVKKNQNNTEINQVNTEKVEDSISDADTVLREVA